MNLTHAAIIFLLIVFIGQTAVYSQDKSMLQLADEYSLALKKYERQKSKTSVESVLRKGEAVSAKLEVIEDLSDADYLLLEKKMKGFVVNREEILYIEPDLKFFAQLAKTRGTKSDVAFFALMRQIKPDNVWAAYIEQQTDVTGCTRFGSGLMTRLYGKALQFKRTYPKAYRAEIDEEISDLASKFNDNLCACGDRASVLREFRLFIKTFPRDKHTPEIKKYLKNVKSRKDFTYNCESG
jgi:hypothetical protein